MYYLNLGTTVAKFFGTLFTDVFNSIYNQQIDQKSAKKVIIGFFVVVGITSVIVVGVTSYKNYEPSAKKIELKKTETKVKKETKKTRSKNKKRKKKNLNSKNKKRGKKT